MSPYFPAHVTQFLHSSQRHLLVYESVFVDVRRLRHVLPDAIGARDMGVQHAERTSSSKGK